MKNINSLKNSSEFKRVYQCGKSFANKNLVMYVLEKNDQTSCYPVDPRELPVA